MKTTIEIDIDEKLLGKVNSYALNHNTSFSEIVENFLTQLSNQIKETKPKKRKNILDLIENLPSPNIKKTSNLKIRYFEKKGKL